VAGCCEHGNEAPSYTLKGEFLVDYEQTISSERKNSAAWIYDSQPHLIKNEGNLV
jgi:hypothetical protein